jgi:hypothetical protein
MSMSTRALPIIWLQFWLTNRTVPVLMHLTLITGVSPWIWSLTSMPYR